MIFDAVVNSVKSNGKVTKISFSCGFGDLSMMILDTQKRFEIGSKIKVGFKSSDVVILRDDAEIISLNKFSANVSKINRGEIISCARLSCGESKFDVILDAVASADLKPNSRVFVHISETSFFLSEIL